LQLFVFARFHAREGQQAALAQAICESVTASRMEAGCLNIDAFRSVRDPGLFYIHSRWKDEAAFDLHAELPHTVRFLARARPLIDHALDVTRTERCAF
jgi:quinol monooxygenase YgiN